MNSNTTNEWEVITANLERAETLTSEHSHRLRDSVNYLRVLLGEDALVRTRTRWTLRHPLFSLLGAPINIVPSTRLDLVRWVDHLRLLEGSPNVQRVLDDMLAPTKCLHSYRLTEIAWCLKSVGLKIAFEPPPPTSPGKRPDLLLEFPETKERLYLELSRQTLANDQLAAFDSMALCQQPVWAIGSSLKYSGRLMRIPSEQHLADICGRIEAAAIRASADQVLVEISEEDTLEMVICPRAMLAEFEAWCQQRGLSGAAFQGPPDNLDESRRLQRKIHAKHSQLPPGYANLLIVENDYIFSHRPDTAELISELEQEVHACVQVALVIVRGRHNTSRDEPSQSFERRGHRFQRRQVAGQVEETLLLLNRYAETIPSDQLYESIGRAFFSRPES
jgi:hypothetical protein